MSLSISTLCMRMRARALYSSNGLHIPPVAESQILRAENRLGFQLPPVLRELYMSVANGGDFFAPGCLLHGIADECSGNHAADATLESLVGNGPRLFDPNLVAALRHSRNSYVICKDFPKGFVILCPIGGDVWVVLDGFTRYVYIRQDQYEHGKFVGGSFSYCADSVEEWLERTLADFPFDASITQYQPEYPLTRLDRAESRRNETGAVSIGAETQKGAVQGGQSENYEHGNTRNLSQLAAHFDTPAARSYRHLRHRLQQVREGIVRQIYELDAVEQAAKQITVVRQIREGDVLKQADMPSDNRLAQGFARSEVMQRLSDAEAQVYALELDAAVI